MFRRLPIPFAVIIALLPASVWAADFVLTLPQQAVLSLETRDALATRSLAIGPFKDGVIATKTMTAPLQDSAFRVALDANMSTASLLAPLRSQLITAGFTPIYECETRVCGGFDFRFGLDLLPEPEMHVDLGDFRYFLGQKGDDLIGLMVSRSANYGFVQVTRMGEGAKPAPKITESSKSPQSASPQPASAIGAALAGGGSVVMQGVVFASGQTRLENTQAPALQDLADWLRANPAQKVTITGHTDASGQSAANTVLSAARAEMLRDILVTQYQIAADRITAIGAGDTMPLAPNDTAEGRAQNRRVEVSVTP